MLKIYQEKLNWIEKTVLDTLFTASVTGFLDQRINGSMKIFKKNLTQLKDCNYSQERLFFVYE